MKKESQISLSLREIRTKLFENSLNKMSEELGILYSQLSNYGKGRNPSAEILKKFADYGINVNYILTGTGSMFADNQEGRALLQKHPGLEDISINDREQKIYNLEIADIIKIVSETIKHYNR